MALLLTKAQRLDPGTLVALFTVDLSPYGGEALFLHGGGQSPGDTVPWQGNAYVPFPIEITGVEATTNGQLPRPTLNVGNENGVITALCQRHRDLTRVQVTRHLTTLEFTDGQPGADPTQAQVESWFIEQKTGETETAVQFSLVSAIDAEGLLLPAQQISAHYCVSTYRGPECGWANGDLLFDRNDNPLPWTTDRGPWDGAANYNAGDKVYLLNKGIRSYYVAKAPSANAYPPFAADAWNKEQCGKRRSSCECRYGVGNVLPALLFPASWRIG